MASGSSGPRTGFAFPSLSGRGFPPHANPSTASRCPRSPTGTRTRRNASGSAGIQETRAGWSAGRASRSRDLRRGPAGPMDGGRESGRRGA
ncbi:unnamed protein product [Darwinula stevensoni]|uniref:Uncharacterized protein n=1 Tax=Darwinula stevensoni TaxID=69355 RepID=A0A7R9AJZ9_9CRUS|nr:unnamed protein product [Darwinula stevensoni]CAG0908924.1 unnamed protein product [Darwinula stevensoni]